MQHHDTQGWHQPEALPHALEPTPAEAKSMLLLIGGEELFEIYDHHPSLRPLVEGLAVIAQLAKPTQHKSVPVAMFCRAMTRDMTEVTEDAIERGRDKVQARSKALYEDRTLPRMHEMQARAALADCRAILIAAMDHPQDRYYAQWLTQAIGSVVLREKPISSGRSGWSDAREGEVSLPVTTVEATSIRHVLSDAIDCPTSVEAQEVIRNLQSGLSHDDLLGLYVATDGMKPGSILTLYDAIETLANLHQESGSHPLAIDSGEIMGINLTIFSEQSDRMLQHMQSEQAEKARPVIEHAKDILEAARARPQVNLKHLEAFEQALAAVWHDKPPSVRTEQGPWGRS